jgi:hypothetical protein
MGRIRSRWLNVVAAAVLVAACGGDDSVSLEDWEQEWLAVHALVPTQQELGASPSQDRCDEILVGIRQRASELVPAPDPTLDDAVKDWIAIAENMFFECPPVGPPIGSFDEGYQELERFAAQVAVVLELDRDEDT